METIVSAAEVAGGAVLVGVLAGVTALDVRLVQWGISPFAETSGLGALGYAPPIAGVPSAASGRPAGNASAAAPGLATAAAAFARRRGRALTSVTGFVSAALSFLSNALSPAVAASLSR